MEITTKINGNPCRFSFIFLVVSYFTHPSFLEGLCNLHGFPWIFWGVQGNFWLVTEMEVSSLFLLNLQGGTESKSGRRLLPKTCLCLFNAFQSPIKHVKYSSHRNLMWFLDATSGAFYIVPSVLRALHHVYRIGQNPFQRDDPLFRFKADPPVINFLGSWFWCSFFGWQASSGTTWNNMAKHLYMYNSRVPPDACFFVSI